MNLIFWGQGSEWFWSFIQVVIIPITIYFVIRQLKAQNQNNQITLLNSLEEKWTSLTMKRNRMAVCSKVNYRHVDLEEEEILWFFEKIAIYHSRKTLDLEIIWEYYSYYIENYFKLLEKNIIDIQTDRNDKTIFSNFVKLHSKIIRLSSKKTKSKYAVTNEQFKIFLDSEIRLAAKDVSNKLAESPKINLFKFLMSVFSCD